MITALRSLARRMLAIRPTAAYTLPWRMRPGLACSLLPSDAETRFAPSHKCGPFPRKVEQHDAGGSLTLAYDVRSHLLLPNLSNMTNLIRVAASAADRSVSARLVALPPIGASLFGVSSLSPAAARGTGVWRLRLQGNAWFNFYVVGAGTRDLGSPPSLMHVT